MQTKALETAKKYEKEALERIRRMSLAAADLEVRGVPKRTPVVLSEGWMDDSRRQISTGDMPMG